MSDFTSLIPVAVFGAVFLILAKLELRVNDLEKRIDSLELK
jgi:hypothetical protein